MILTAVLFTHDYFSSLTIITILYNMYGLWRTYKILMFDIALLREFI